MAKLNNLKTKAPAYPSTTLVSSRCSINNRRNVMAFLWFLMLRGIVANNIPLLSDKERRHCYKILPSKQSLPPYKNHLPNSECIF